MAKFIVDCFNGYGMRLYNVSTRSTTCMLKFFLPAFVGMPGAVMQCLNFEDYPS